VNEMISGSFTIQAESVKSAIAEARARLSSMGVRSYFFGHIYVQSEEENVWPTFTIAWVAAEPREFFIP